MRNLHRPALIALFLSLSILPAAASVPVTIERELRFDPSRISLIERDGETSIEMKGASREFTPGRPDLPLLGEPIELPDGVRVTGVEVISFSSAMLKSSARVPAAIKALPGLGPIVRTAPDPAFYGRSGFGSPSSYATLGYQGWMRGKHVAWLSVSPVRWDPATGRLERITQMKVRLNLEPYDDPDVVRRERIVPEWEDSNPFAAPQPPSALPAGGRRAEPFKPLQIPSVLGSPVAYVIITTDALAADFQTLADWKTQSGVPAVVRTLSFIRQQYPFGADDADRIRQFIRDAYSRWGTKWVLLGGDTEIIPFRMIYTTFFSGEHIPCDLYFSCLDGNWNADGDSTYGEGFYSVSNTGDACDLLPEVYVGRAPVVTVADVQQFVTKNFQYTRTPVGDYEHMVQFFAEVLFPQDWVAPPQGTSLDGAELVEEVLPSLQSNPGIHYLRQYQNYTDGRWEPGALQETKAAVIDSLNAGYNLSVHVGHGYRNVMSCGDATLENSDVMTLANGNRLSNMYAIDCTSNAIDFPCIGEAFLLAPNGGAVTNIGSSRFDFPHSGRAFQAEYMELMFVDSVTAVGEAQALQKVPFAVNSVGDNINRWTETTLLMLGDPELRQWTGKPRTLTVVHPPTYALSDTSMLVNVKIGAVPLYGAKVTLYKSGDDYRSVTTDGAGNALLDFRPGSTGTFSLTVTGFDCRPFHVELSVGAASAPVLADLAPVIDDDNAGGTSGNGDGQFDAGETVDLTVPVINRGGSSTGTVIGALSSTDGMVTVIDPDVSYGTIAPSATSNGTGTFRLSIPYTCPDQREIPFTLSLVEGGRHHAQRFSLTTRGPEPRHFAHAYMDLSGNGDGIPDAGETISLFLKLLNLGTGPAPDVTVKLRNYDGLATVTDSTAAFGVIASAQEVQGDALAFSVGSTAAKLEVRISDAYGLLSTHMMDLVSPATPIALAGVGSATSIKLVWTHVTAPDLAGYNLYRSTSSGGPFAKVGAVPTDRTSYYRDEGLVPLTRYYYKVTAVDSSGNESGQSLMTDVSTNPPMHQLFPVEMRRTTPASVAIEHVYQATMMDIAAGADVLWLWHADGTAPIDADGTAVSHGDFTKKGTYYAAGPSLAKLDGVNWSIIGGSWRNTAPESLHVYVFDKQGQVRPGWPFRASDGLFSGIAVGDLDNDGSSELVFATNGTKFYVLRADGTEWMDGDLNPATTGVFKVLAGSYNYGTPAIADLDNNGQKDIIYASADGQLYAWRPDGSSFSGFPKSVGFGTNSSVAIGYIDGPTDTELDIVVTGNSNYLHVIGAGGTLHPGFPVSCRYTQGFGRSPSPALADMNGDGFVDIVTASTDGKIYVFDHNAVALPTFINSRYSALIDGFASESSPVVADINGDLVPDVVMGDEAGVLNAISGLDGSLLPGFPIQLGGEVRGTPAVCDCDGDGMTEILVSAWDQNTYMWDYDFSFSPAGPPPWPQFHHDAQRTGSTTTLAFLDAPTPEPSVVPTTVEFATPVPNPASTRARASWAVPSEQAGADLDLSVYDLSGRHIATLASGKAEPGRFTKDWDLRSAEGARVGSGIYFLRFRLGSFLAGRKLVVMP